ncbi:RraA family protein [Alteromonas oceanisediminis]|uniref:RraA family protein n=1 Tax=Alteromonas oceanisediminis TaxID=2836180 RepID=UPI001BD97EB9|nr:RraA family protein [Alteromonas oceanisediminis]MBT0586988.1 RraA family protein [Alteromonas oceanisediminis]
MAIEPTLDNLYQQLSVLSPCDLADALPFEQFVDPAIAGLWAKMPRIVGRAFTVECFDNDHLMFHAAVYRAHAGDIIVAKGGASAMAGGNVCAIAQRRGVTGFIIDGSIRDLAEIRTMAFPVFARNVMPKPGVKKQLGTLGETIECGGVAIHRGDFIVADEEGIAVIPAADVANAIKIASARALKDASLSLDDWQAQHEATVSKALRSLGFTE